VGVSACNGVVTHRMTLREGKVYGNSRNRVWRKDVSKGGCMIGSIGKDLKCNENILLSRGLSLCGIIWRCG